MVQERGPRQPLTRQDRFFLRNSGIGKEDLWGKVEQAKKDPKIDIFSPNFGRLQFDAKFNELKTRGVIREIFVTTDLGKRDMEDYERRRMILGSPIRKTPPVVQVLRSRPVEAKKLQPVKEQDSPTLSPKKRKDVIRLDDLGKFRDQFKSE